MPATYADRLSGFGSAGILGSHFVNDQSPKAKTDALKAFVLN